MIAEKAPHSPVILRSAGFRQRATVVNPLRLTDESRIPRHLEDFFRRVLVAALGPDGFAFVKLDRADPAPPGCAPSARRFDCRCISTLRASRIDPGDVSELAQIEIGVEFAIDAGKQVQIESGRSRRLRRRRPRAVVRSASPGRSRAEVNRRVAECARTSPEIQFRRDDRNFRWCCRETARRDAGRVGGGRPLPAIHRDIRAQSRRC